MTVENMTENRNLERRDVYFGGVNNGNSFLEFVNIEKEDCERKCKDWNPQIVR
jgi:hypothetical protein